MIQETGPSDPGRAGTGYGLLRRDEIDVLAFWVAGIDQETDLVAGPVLEHRDRVLAVGRGHRLADRHSVSVEELVDEQTHDGSGFPPSFFDVLVPRLTPSGRPIRARRRGGVWRRFPSWSPQGGSSTRR